MIFFCLVCVALGAVAQSKVLDYVDLFICTSGDHGQLDPSATVPFGMIKLGPDTEPGNHSGYNFEANEINGFSHNRIGGVGCTGAGGNLRILPSVGELELVSEPFIKASETASPAYYAVQFENGIKAQLTTTNQCGFHRYTYPSSDQSYIVFDLESSFGGTISTKKEILNEHEFLVQVAAKNVCGVGRYIANYHIWCSKNLSDMVVEGGKLFARFSTQAGEEVLLNVTTSTLSMEDARKEWESEIKTLDFDEVKERGAQKWERLLSKITVEGKEEYKTLFYTHLYHIFLNPVKSENRNNEFKATNGKVYRSEDYVHYDCWSMWDNFRNKFSLYPIIAPEVASDIANSLVDLYLYGKPYWSGYHEPVPTVRTEHTVVSLLDLYQRGVTDFDIEPMYEKMSVEITNIYENTPDTKLEKCYDYWALAQFAKILDKEDDYLLYMEKSMDYKTIWMKYFLHMNEESDIMHGEGLYEGTLWQYRWHAHYDLDGMIEMMGGKENYTNDLEYFFNNHLYNHGNQPDIHVPFLFNFGTKPWLTQKWVNQILTKDMFQYYGTHTKWDVPYHGRIYKNDPEGYIPEMDDDDGTMSGWYVLASMGLYPVLVGDPVFQLSAPIFQKITFHLENGKEFVIKTNGLEDDCFYIKSAKLNGKQWEKPYVRHQDIVAGGTLEFDLTDSPNANWGL